MTAKDTELERLETILRELREAVVACDPQVRIILYNSSARQLFRNYEAMGLGRSLYEVCARAPIEHALRMLKGRSTDRNLFDPEQTDARFVCATVDETMLLRCHISQITADAPHGSIFVFTFEDITRQIAEMGGQGHLLEKMIKQLRAPLTNLGTAVENLKDYPHMEPEIRREFEEIIFRESAELTHRFETLAREAGRLTRMQWPLFDVYSADLIGCVARKLKEEEGITVTMTGVPLWLHGDSYSLMLVLERLVRIVRLSRNVSEIDIEALLGDRRVYIDLVWKGEPIPQASVDSMLTARLPDTAGGMTVADVLERHDSEIWSQPHRRMGYAVLRVPVPDSPRQWEVPDTPVPRRREFYDFSLAAEMGEPGEMAERRLASLSYVVFDTETTGLSPEEGDEILAIAAVRIVNGRILSGERFERFIRPRGPLPERSRRFLDITEEILRDESPVEVVLPQFKNFVGDAVLVAHNGIFDMKFFHMMEEKSGVRLANPMLDTLLLALIVNPERKDFTLENIGRWLGVETPAGHVIMGDCYVTAQIFLKLLELLELAGMSTLGEVMAASEKVAEEKRRQFR
ncbi:MAG TPA: histidine kinase [Desulfobacteraceae bacterium]|nr:histidine kinase [Desulfobacteraceae bacterium]